MKFDKEYATQWSVEVDYLEKKGIKPVFIKKDEQQLRTYKYIKDDKLFKMLSEFYNSVK